MAGMEPSQAGADPQEAEERLRIMLDSMPFACTFWDRDAKPIDCNRKTLDIFGCKSKEDYLANFFNFSPEYQSNGCKSADKIREDIRKTYKIGSKTFGWEHITAAGEPLPVKMYLLRVAWKNGFRIVSYLRDMREIRAKEEAARKIGERMRLMLDSIPMACVFLDDAGEIIDCNAFTPKFFGFTSKKQFLAQPYNWMPEYQPGGKHSQTEKLRLIQEVLKTGSSHFDWHYQLVSGEDVPAAVWLVRVEWDGRFCVAAYIRDLREQKAAEETARGADRRRCELEIQSRAARDASEAKSAFLAAMSHEIRTPLNAIMGFSEIALQKELPADTYASLEKIYQAGATLLGIVNDILDISKIEAGSFALVPAAYALADLIHDTVQLNTARIGSRPVVFKLSVDPAVPARLTGDELRVKQILNNLLSNAFKYTDRGEVSLRVTGEADRENADAVWLVFDVRDTGRGIRRDDLGRLFSQYVQFDTKANRHIEGTGLGLPITKNLVELMHGTIAAESAYGEGSRFTVRIRQGIADPAPLGEKAAGDLRRFRFMRQSAPRSRNLARAPMPGGRVLVVDDVQTNLDVARGLMRPYGLVIDGASSGREAIAKIRAVCRAGGPPKYDLVLMDHMMPGMDGMETVKIIRNGIDSDYARTVPVIALTANALKGSEGMFLSGGFNGYISKPIDIFSLDAALNTWIRDKQPPGEAASPAVRDGAAGFCGGASAPGINMAAAQERYGESAVFLEILRSFCTHIPALLDKLRDFSDGDTAGYAISVHGLKGACYCVCADAAGKCAEALEKAARAGDAAAVRAQNGALVARVEELLAGLRELAAGLKKGDGEKPRAAEPDRALLAALLRGCKRYMPALMETAIAELEKYDYDRGGELIPHLREQRDNLEYDAIRDMLEQQGVTEAPESP
jgi:signal transduction histidine kinase/CheY-like chemotaxis protein/HPt (histidine-containing phosphotransfer) domain-containing protein